jgi:sugar-specific transcriptional regulator TrmB
MIHENQGTAVLLGALGQLGLTAHEQSLYVLALQRGPSSASMLAEELGISRPNVYKVMTGLEKHGLADVPQSKTRGENFAVLSPSIVFDVLEKKRTSVSNLTDSFKNALPGLLSLYQQGGLPTRIRLIEGKEDFMNVYNQILDESGGSIRYFGSAADFIGFISWAEEREWIVRRLSKKVFIHCLITASKDAETLKKSDEKELRETRTFTPAEPVIASYHVFANKVVFWQPKTPLALLIEDEYLVALLRNSFDLMWSMKTAST